MASFVSKRRRQNEPTLPLINIVFLMLIFFLVAAQLSRPLDSDLRLVQTDDPNRVPPPDAIVLGKDGGITFRGKPHTAQSAWQVIAGESAGTNRTARILPDQRSSAQSLVTLANALEAAGASSIHIVTERQIK